MNEFPHRARGPALILIAGDVRRDVALELLDLVPMGAGRVASPPLLPGRVGGRHIEKFVVVPIAPDRQMWVKGREVRDDLYKTAFCRLEEIACRFGP